MAEVTVSIGGRSFQVACQQGEEHYLTNAAALLDAEAGPLLQQVGRLPESRMLLMAGLLLADKTGTLEEENRRLRAELDTLLARPTPEPERVEVPFIPPQVIETLAEIAARAEALADRVEEQATAGE